MKTQLKRGAIRGRGFTLIELLVVISIIGILAGILIPTLSKAKTRAAITKATTEIQGIKAAIQQYYNDENRYPTPQWVRKQGVRPPAYPDYTFGTFNVSAPANPAYDPGKNLPPTLVPSTFPGGPSTNNSALMMVLMNIEPGTLKQGNPENRRNNIYLEAKSAGSATESGLGPDYVYRDPWGSPYIISLDLDYDGQTMDAFYRTDNIAKDSSGNMLLGLVNVNKDAAAVRDSIVVWSMGPDKQARNDSPQYNALQAPNKDNILSWQ